MSALRRIFLWLLVLALPVQGYAAVAMLNCDMQPMPGQAQPFGAQPQAHAHSHHAAMAHGSAASEQDVRGSTHAHDGASDQQVSAEASLKCGACHSCCMSSTSLPTVALSVSAAEGVFPDSSWLQPASIQVLRARLERPPRT